MSHHWTSALRGALVAVGLLTVVVGPVRAELSTVMPELVTGPNFAPFTGDDLPQGGLMTELVQRAFKAAGRSYGVRFVPWKRGYDGVVSGRFLASFPFVRTPERERDALFSDPLIEVRQFVYMSTHTRMSFTGPEDFRGRVVCAPIGFALPVELDAMVRQGELTRESPSDLTACVRMVATGRADAFVLDEYTGSTAVIHAGVINDIRVAERPYATVSLHLIVGRVTPDAPAILAGFNEGLRALKSSDVYQEMLARHTAVAPR